jgi:hypothetical protein
MLRQHTRSRAEVSVDWWVDGALAHVVSRTEDLSRGGVFIATSLPLAVGTPVRLQLPARVGAVLRGRVIRSQPDGMAIAFAGASG